MDRIWEWVVRQWDNTNTQTVTLRSVYVLFAVLMVIVLCARFIPVPRWHRHKSRKSPADKREQQKMEEAQKYKEKRQAVSDAIFDGLFALYGESKLSRAEFKYWAHRIGNTAGLPDLLPKIRLTHPDAIRAQAKRTLEAIKARRANGTEKPVKLPDESNIVKLQTIPAKAVRRTKGAA